MIQEIAEITVKPGMQAPFEAGIAQAKPLFLRARGCHGVSLKHSIEEPARYLLVVDWETVEDHMTHFRASADFQTWRKLVGDCFAAPPQVQHVSTVL
jgi:heme-degrading monooxygenase HmoA